MSCPKCGEARYVSPVVGCYVCNRKRKKAVRDWETVANQLADALAVFDYAETYLCDEDDEKTEGPIELAHKIISERETE